MQIDAYGRVQVGRSHGLIFVYSLYGIEVRSYSNFSGHHPSGATRVHNLFVLCWGRRRCSYVRQASDSRQDETQEIDVICNLSPPPPPPPPPLLRRGTGWMVVDAMFDLSRKTCVLAGGTSGLGTGIFELSARAKASCIILLSFGRGASKITT